MKRYSTAIGAALLGALVLSTYSQSQTTAPKPAPAVKIAVVAMHDAMIATQEGQKAQKEMVAKFEPRRAELAKLAKELQSGDEELRKGSLSADARQKLLDDLSGKKKKYDRDLDDLNTEMQAEDNRVSQEMNGKFGKLLDTFARANAYSLVMDAEQPVLWAAESANVTSDIIKAYDKAHPVAVPAVPATPAKK
jgi:outer membrane protein